VATVNGCSPEPEQTTDDEARSLRVGLLDALLAADLTCNEAADFLYGWSAFACVQPRWRSPGQYAEMTEALERMLFRAGFKLR
jgi:hypothetical protein